MKLTGFSQPLATVLVQPSEPVRTTLFQGYRVVSHQFGVVHPSEPVQTTVLHRFGSFELPRTHVKLCQVSSVKQSLISAGLTDKDTYIS